MDRIFEVTAGLDVHRDTVAVTVRRRELKKEVVQTRTFETFHDGLDAMVQWLTDERIEVAGLESTGVYWQPVVRVLQHKLPRVLIWLVNPLHVKKVAGRKTDVSDSQWLSKLVMYGLVQPSFLPNAELQELRKLTRHRTKLTADQTRFKNRIIKEIESSGLKLASVCTDVLGKTGRALLDAALSGKALDQEAILNLAHGNLRKRVPELHRALQGDVSPSTALVLRQQLGALDRIIGDIAALETEVQRLAAVWKSEIDRLLAIPGVNEVAAAAIIAETGADMSLFQSAKHITAWGGLCPGSDESAGKSKNAPTRKGNKYLRTILVQVAMSAKNAKGTFWQSKFRRLARLGPKKAAVALARSLLTGIFHMLRDGVPYRDPLTIPPPPHRVRARTTALIAQLEALGLTVTVTPAPGVVS